MKYELEVYDALCATAIFTINGIEANAEDFGDLYDCEPRMDEEYGCGNRIFEVRPPSPEILQKYNITKEEYATISEELREKLSFGSCSWCA